MNPSSLATDPFVSVVTPVYNGERYLGQCIESVLSQTYKNWEYIILNNCSKDRTLEIAENFAKKDARIHVHSNQEFVGAMRNHNLALQKISEESKYCKPLQADDWLFPTCLEKMVALAETNPAVGVVSSYQLRDRQVISFGVPYPSQVVSGKEFCRWSLLGVLRTIGTVSSYLFRSDNVRKHIPFFNEAHIYGDTEACYRVLRDSDFGFVHDILTYFRTHDEQLSSYGRRLNIWGTAARLDLLLRFGPIYLTPDEYKRRLSQILDEYYRFLGKNVFKTVDKGFWSYHRKTLREWGFPLSFFKLMKGAFLEAALFLSRPGRKQWTAN